MQEYKVVSHDIPLGHRWEHYARRIVFDISAWVDSFGPGTVQLLHQRQGDEYPYPVAVTRTDADGETVNDTTGTLVFWDVTNTDTAQVCRYGKAELRYYRGTQVSPEFLAKSDIYRTTVENALGGALATAPEETPDWLATLLDAANSVDDRISGAVSDARGYADAAQGYAQAAQQANTNAAQEARTYAANAAQSADDARQAARDAASSVAGYVSDARSAANDAANSAQDAADYVADTQGQVEYNTFLMEKFLTMDVSAQSLPSTSAASAQFGVSGDSPENLTISMRFGIPRGEKGDDGVSVTDVSQTVTSSESGGVNTITATLSDGTTRSFNVVNGARGETGEPFRIAKTYASVAAMNADAASVTPGAFVVIASDTEDPDNAKLYVRGENGFTFITDLSGARGIQGPAGADGVSVSTVTHTTDASGNIVVTLTLSNGNSSTFTIPKGDIGPQGPKGDTGTFSAADLQRVTALESENALLRELLQGVDAPIYRTKSGNPATFSDGGAANVKALSVTLTPTQSGSGDPYPPGGGKNLLDITASSATINGVTFTVNRDAAGNVTGVTANGTATATAIFALGAMSFQGGIGYALTGTPSGQGRGKSVVLAVNTDAMPQQVDYDGSGVTFTPDADYTTRISIIVYSGVTVSNVEYLPMLRLASDADPTFAPYSNIRPISGVSSVTVTRTGENGANPQAATVSLIDSNNNPLAVYGGTLNVTTGKLNVTHGYLNSFNWVREAINGGKYRFKCAVANSAKSDKNKGALAYCNALPLINEAATSIGIQGFTINLDILWVYVEGVETVEDMNTFALKHGLEFLYPLVTPVTYTLTPAQLATLSGYNTVSTDAGTLSVTYRADTTLSFGGG